jgi:hypothetical protein
MKLFSCVIIGLLFWTFIVSLFFVNSIMNSEAISSDLVEENLSESSVSRTSGLSSSAKKRTPRASKKDLDSLRKDVTDFKGEVSSLHAKFDQLMGFMTKNNSETVLQRPSTSDTQENFTSGESRPVPLRDNTAPGGSRPLLPLTNSLNRDYNIPEDDVLSLQPGQRERSELGIDSDEDARSRASVEIVDADGIPQPDRFTKYSSKTEKLLAQMFGEDALTKPDKDTSGLLIDDSQVTVLKESWRSSDPSRISAYKDIYKSTFPVSDSAEDLLQVPSLDTIVESLLMKKYGSKAASKSQSLYSQPLKALEKIAFQGQCAARMGIIINLYIQQALGNLLSFTQENSLNVDKIIQCVRDIFAMSTKSLDQISRCGAFHHLVRRKAALADTGLHDLRDIKDHLWTLPLSHTGVFGDGMEKKLKDRKEMNSQLSDLLPEVGRKRKFPDSTSSNQWKRPRLPNQTFESRPARSQFPSYRQPQRPNSSNFTIPKVVKSQPKTSNVSSTFRNKST